MIGQLVGSEQRPLHGTMPEDRWLVYPNLRDPVLRLQLGKGLGHNTYGEPAWPNDLLYMFPICILAIVFLGFGPGRLRRGSTPVEGVMRTSQRRPMQHVGHVGPALWYGIERCMYPLPVHGIDGFIVELYRLPDLGSGSQFRTESSCFTDDVCTPLG